MTIERDTEQLAVMPTGRVVRYSVDQVGNNLTKVLRWCSTHLEPVWQYSDGTTTECRHETIVGWAPDPHVIVDAPWEHP